MVVFIFRFLIYGALVTYIFIEMSLRKSESRESQNAKFLESGKRCET